MAVSDKSEWLKGVRLYVNLLLKKIRALSTLDVYCRPQFISFGKSKYLWLCEGFIYYFWTH